MSATVSTNGGTVTMTGTVVGDKFTIQAANQPGWIYTLSGSGNVSQTGQNDTWSPAGGSLFIAEVTAPATNGVWTMTAANNGLQATSSSFNPKTNQVSYTAGTSITTNLTPSGAGE